MLYTVYSIVYSIYNVLNILYTRYYIFAYRYARQNGLAKVMHQVVSWIGIAAKVWNFGKHCIRFRPVRVCVCVCLQLLQIRSVSCVANLSNLSKVLPRWFLNLLCGTAWEKVWLWQQARKKVVLAFSPTIFGLEYIVTGGTHLPASFTI